jgi:hypothetical protein
VVAPGAEQLLGLPDHRGRLAPGRVAHVFVDGLPLCLCLRDVALGYPIVLDVQIDQHTKPGQQRDDVIQAPLTMPPMPSWHKMPIRTVITITA